MAYTRVSNTRNGMAAVRYAFEEPSHKEGMDRVLMASGSNVAPQFAAMQMKATWDSFGKNDGKAVQMYRIIQSFGLDELDAANPEHVEKANEVGLQLAAELYPDRQALIVTQADGDGGKLHNHILVNSVSFIDGKSLRGQRTGWKAISDKSDSILRQQGMQPLMSKKAWDKETIAERKLSDKGEYVWKRDLKTRIEQGLDDASVTDKDRFIERMKEDFSVDVNYRGKGISYAFIDEEGKKRSARSSRLGAHYEKDNIQETFTRNIEMNQKSSESNGGVSVSDFITNELDAVMKSRKKYFANKSERKSIDSPERPGKSNKRQLELAEKARKKAEQERAQKEQEEKELQEQLKEQQRLEQEERVRLEEERRRRVEEEEKEKARREREMLAQKEREEERAKELERQREQAEKRIQEATFSRKAVSPEIIDRFMESSKELEGKMRSTVTGEKVPYSDLEIYRYTNRKIADEKRRQQEAQHAPAEPVAEGVGPEL